MSTTLPVAQPELEAALTRLRTRPSGAHELTVQLHPADLGAVRVVATLSGDRLDVTVLCADHEAQQAVAAAVPALHERLSELSHIDIRSAADMTLSVPKAAHTDLAGPSHQPPGSFGDASHRPPHGGSERRPATLPTGRAEASTADHAPPSSRPNRRTAGADGRFDRRI